MPFQLKIWGGMAQTVGEGLIKNNCVTDSVNYVLVPAAITKSYSLNGL